MKQISTLQPVGRTRAGAVPEGAQPVEGCHAGAGEGAAGRSG